MGILGPGDSIKLTFNVKVAENATEGTHNLELAIEGNSFDYNSRKNIPLESRFFKYKSNSFKRA